MKNQNRKPNHDFSERQEEQQRIQQHQQIVAVLKEDIQFQKRLILMNQKQNIEYLREQDSQSSITDEELYINGKKLKSAEESQILSALKDKISSIANGDNDTSAEQPVTRKRKEKIEAN